MDNLDAPPRIRVSPSGDKLVESLDWPEKKSNALAYLSMISFPSIWYIYIYENPMIIEVSFFWFEWENQLYIYIYTMEHILMYRKW